MSPCVGGLSSIGRRARFAINIIGIGVATCSDRIFAKKVDHLSGSMIGQKKSYVYPWVDALVCIASYLRFLELFGLTRDCSL